MHYNHLQCIQNDWKPSEILININHINVCYENTGNMIPTAINPVFSSYSVWPVQKGTTLKHRARPGTGHPGRTPPPEGGVGGRARGPDGRGESEGRGVGTRQPGACLVIEMVNISEPTKQPVSGWCHQKTVCVWLVLFIMTLNHFKPVQTILNIQHSKPLQIIPNHYKPL